VLTCLCVLHAHLTHWQLITGVMVGAAEAAGVRVGTVEIGTAGVVEGGVVEGGVVEDGVSTVIKVSCCCCCCCCCWCCCPHFVAQLFSSTCCSQCHSKIQRAASNLITLIHSLTNLHLLVHTCLLCVHQPNAVAASQVY
jgi:hypothetical protein